MVDGQWGQETEWLRLARMGDTTAYAELLAPVLADAARLAYGLLQDHPTAEDSVQEAAILAWRRLENGHRVAIVLHFYLDLPLEEVSAVLGPSIAGVKARINRGLRRLRLALEAEQR